MPHSTFTKKNESFLGRGSSSRHQTTVSHLNTFQLGRVKNYSSFVKSVLTVCQEYDLVDFPTRQTGAIVTVVAMHSFPQPLSNVLIGQLYFHFRCTRAGELISAVGVAEVTPNPSEI